MVKKKELIGQTQSKIFDAATEVFEEKGYTGARMQEIADRAGINKALLHYYFRTKDQLFSSVFQALMKRMLDKMLSIFSEEATFKEKMRRFLDEHIEFLIKNPRLPIFLLNEISRNPELAQGLKETLNYGQIRDLIYDRHSKELKGYGIKKSDMPQLMITIVGMSVFPVAARDLIAIVLPQMNENRKFNAFMQERKEFAAGFVMTALKNRKK